MGLCQLCLGLDFASIMRTDVNSPLAAVIQGRKPPISPRSRTSLKSITDWLHGCSSVHGHRHVSTLQPTRLLKYEEDLQKVVLGGSIEPHAKYAALSHCWGSVQPLTLNSKTAEKLGLGIPIGDLPQTFQDALWLTGQLCIPYLWIDSLCILQYDPDDWAHESSHMCDVYGNAYLTIAATRAENSMEGFLGSRLSPTSITIPFRADDISGEVSAFLLPHKVVAGPTRVMNMEDAPLSQRAWALQERYLSPRTVHFTDSQTYLECDLCFVAEDGRCTRVHPFHGGYVIQPNSAQQDTAQRMRAWRYIVERYTRRGLTVETDKLPAIGGLAARFPLNEISKEDQSVPDNCYVAGLWKDDLLRGMCWEIDQYYPLAGAPSTYMAPSWSWASVKSAIDYSTDWFGAIEELALVQSAAVDLGSIGNAFGKVTGGWIHLPVIKLRPYRKERKHFLWFREGEAEFRVSVKWDSPRYGLPEYDWDTESIDDRLGLVAVPLGWIKRHIHPSDNPDLLIGPFFLIMVPSQTNSSPMDNLPHFQRVGLGTALGLPDQELDKTGVRRLVEEKFLRDKEQGMLEDIVVL
ncbi:heterokaryon incompatibility [Fusarium albosuccineum]|uniref:Heterokaryon incompatibility n=1 Tax=Fusarium albosuccineum TaxID=1237068 RepID=A0A8H4KWB3_9HYPO|nr:heterokaryon incompatibility [Fusarium albosuccineum]